MKNKLIPNLDLKKVKEIIKSITIDKWILMGIAGAILILCSDSCSGDSASKSSDKDNYNLFTNESADDKYSADSNVNNYEDENTYISKMEKRLEEILESVEGAGDVRVMITLKSTSSKEILKEEPYSEKSVNEKDNEGGSRDTVEKSKDYRVIYQSDSDGNSIPFILSNKSPTIEGVAVVAKGGDNILVKEKITSIIKALFDIEINKIAVGKMK